MSDAMLTLISTQLTNMQRTSAPHGVSVAEYNAVIERANVNAEIAQKAQASYSELRAYCTRLEQYATGLEGDLAISEENCAILERKIAQHNEYADKLEAELKDLKRSR